jgi:hypothetical protein
MVGHNAQPDKVLLSAFVEPSKALDVRIAAASLNLSKSEWLRRVIDAGLRRPEIVESTQSAQPTQATQP